MSYRLRQDEPVGEDVSRVVREEIESAISEIGDTQLPRRDTAHQIRKHCKKIRGALRLVRYSFDDYGRENLRFRDLARELSAVRDAEVLRDIQRELLDEISLPDGESDIATLDRALLSHTEIPSGDADRKLETVREGLIGGRTDSSHWSINGNNFTAIERGLRKSYKRGRKALQRCQDEATPGNLHEWRKRAKYHWYHLRLLANTWPKVIKARAVAAHHLASLLGDNHDLAVYVDTLEEMNGAAPARVSKTLRRYAEQRREALLEESLAVGIRLFAEKPRRITERFETYWSVWRQQDSA